MNRLLIALALWLLPALGHAATPAETFKSGLEAYWKGDFAAAAKAWREVVEQVPAPDVYFDLGTAEAEAGHLGPAIWALEQALALRPGDEDAAHNLEQVRALAMQKGMSAAGDLRVILPGDDDVGTGLLTALTPGTLAWLLGASWTLLFGVLITLRLARGGPGRTGLTFAAVLLGLAALASGSLLAGRIFVVHRTEYAIVTADQAKVSAGPGEKYRATALVLAGVKVRVRGESEGWLQVTLPDGGSGWLDRDLLARLRD